MTIERRLIVTPRFAGESLLLAAALALSSAANSVPQPLDFSRLARAAEAPLAALRMTAPVRATGE